MSLGALTGYVDIAQMVLYAFWVFFFGLIVYLQLESRREGFPLEKDPATMFAGRTPDREVPQRPIIGKVFDLPLGGSSRSNRVDRREIKLAPAAPWPGAPLEPTGDPLLDGVGPASYAERADHPDRMLDGTAKIVPLRTLPEFAIETRDADPRSMQVIAGDGEVAGTVRDAWIDQMEVLVRYLEVDVQGANRSVLVPINFADIDRAKSRVHVTSIYAAQFAQVPALANPAQVTLLEEDKICGYYGGGTLYAHPRRAEPIL